LSPIFGRGPWLEGTFGGQYLFSNLFDTSPAANALISWNLTGQPDGDWLTYVVLFGSSDGINGINNVYGVSGGRFQSDWQSVTIDGNAIIYGIAFYGLNPSIPTPDTGSTFLLLGFGLAALVGARMALPEMVGKHLSMPRSLRESLPKRRRLGASVEPPD